jgi:hypothetical protein
LIAFLIPTGCLLLLVGALIAGLTLDIGAHAPSWELRVKVISLNGAFGGGLGGPLALSAALLAALVIGRSAGGLPGVATAICVAAGWLVVVTLLSTIADVSTISSTDDGGYAVGQLLADLGTLVVVGATAVFAAWSTRE